ncbi:MAG: fused MFS/spermidine synthase, partial [Actinomycetota bacterium]|nr:fused MFS/spermidine synthase [Actinomycetota bacterium]
SMMLGVTAFVTTDIAPVPLLWVIPLSLYLFSFVIVFSRSERLPDPIRRAMVFALPAAMGLLVFTVLIHMRSPLWLLILLHLFGFFVVAMVLHGELARDRPPARHLTEFYLWVAVGGVLGGVFNALLAPMIFHSVVEYPLAVVLACLFLPPLFGREEEGTVRRVRWLGPRSLDLIVPLAFGLAVGLLAWAGWSLGAIWGRVAFLILVALATGLCLYFAYVSNRPIRFGLSIAALLVVGTLMGGLPALYGDRSFFGVYKVISNEQAGYHLLEVGNTNHGAQVFGVTPPEPTTYHHRTGPIGQLFDALPNEDVTSRTAILGLGTGSMACYNKPGQRMTFYEIDPLVERIARDPNLFTYLRDCPGESEVALGDARLKMAEAPDAEYGVIVADAFNSDAVPVHLLTREAVDLYLSKLRSDGVLVFHVTNRYLELEPVLGTLAQNRGLSCYGQYDLQTRNIPFKTESHWVVMAREDTDLGSVPDDQRWHPCFRKDGSDGVWTDDFSNLLSTFNWR